MVDEAVRRMSIFKLLILHQIDKNIKDKNGMTALDMASQIKENPVCEILKKAEVLNSAQLRKKLKKDAYRKALHKRKKELQHN